MLPPHIRNKFSDHPQKIMRPISIKLSEEMIDMLKETASERGFNRLQGLLRLYIRQGLDRDNDKYTLADDEVFLETLRQKGVSLEVIEEAVIDAHEKCINQCLLEEQSETK